MKKLSIILAVALLLTLLTGCVTVVNPNPVEDQEATGKGSSVSENSTTTEATISKQTEAQSIATSKKEVEKSQVTKPKTSNTTKTTVPTTKVPSKPPASDKDSGAKQISRAEAKRIALERVGVSEQQISRYSIELDYDDDTRRWEYEISFNVGRVEYDLTLDSITGKILEYEKDVD